MSEPEDPIRAWLDAEVQPLAPPPGTFERVRRRARRRKAGRALMSGAAVAVVLAAAVAVPRSGLFTGHGRSGSSVAQGTRSSSPSHPTPTVSGGREKENTQSGTKVPPPGSSLSPAGSGNPVPGNFQPTSVTFIGNDMGAVIGQAGTPGHCGPPVSTDCTSLAGTSDYGKSWYGVSAPVTGSPDGSLGVSQLRFLNNRDGWAFGPQLYVTHNGGGHWSTEDTHGQRVIALETVGDRAFAVFASGCTGTGADYGQGCAGVALYSSQMNSDKWQPVAGPMASPASSASSGAAARLVLTGGPAGGTGYLLTPTGMLYSGPLTGAAWGAVGPAPCPPGAPKPDGQPTGAQLAAGSGRLYLVCTTAGTASGVYVKTAHVSTDGGKHWQKAGHIPGPGAATSLAAAQGGLVVLATTARIDISTDNAATWTKAYGSPAGAASQEQGFSYVGMTSPKLGVAVPADPSLGEIFITRDGGKSWTPSLIR